MKRNKHCHLAATSAGCAARHTD